MTGSVVIKGGTVMDGTGAAGVVADVRLVGGRVDAIGRKLDGDVAIDASGRVVAPGFIDIHTHYDAQVFWDPALTPSCFHGVTTVVAGNCGFSVAPTRVGDRSLIAHTLEQAVRKLTSVQATLFGFEGRGVLTVGAHADVVASGMHHVFVNGRPVMREGKLVEEALEDRPGVVVPPARRAQR